MSDRCSVYEFATDEPATPEVTTATLRWFAIGVESQQLEAPRAPRLFRPFEWRRQLHHAIAAARAQRIVVPR
jgi:hypothetical protein